MARAVAQCGAVGKGVLETDSFAPHKLEGTMFHLDPFGYGRSTPLPVAEPEDEPITEDERQEEIDLARGVPESAQMAEGDELATSGLDFALRLQDGIGTWLEGGDTTPEEVGHSDASDQSEPEPEPFIPYTDSGGQGI